jgi:hypothetical protein
MDWNKQALLAILDNPAGSVAGATPYPHTKVIYRMLQALYDRQTMDEKQAEYTKHENSVGFNSADAPSLTDIAKKSKVYQNLTVKQAWLVAKRIRKYMGQLIDIRDEKMQKALVFPVQKQWPPKVCNYCNTVGHVREDCDIYWSDVAADHEKEQEARAFMAASAAGF